MNTNIGRYSRAGLAHGAADIKTTETGVQYVMAFRPRYFADPTPFVIVVAP